MDGRARLLLTTYRTEADLVSSRKEVEKVKEIPRDSRKDSEMVFNYLEMVIDDRLNLKKTQKGPLSTW